MLSGDQDLIVKRNKIFLEAISEELTSGNKVCIYFGEEHFNKDPEAQEFRDFLARKKSHVYFAKNQDKPKAQVMEESAEALSWLKPYLTQDNTNNDKTA